MAFFPLLDAYISLIIFSFLLLGTPGPAPLAIAATAAVFGISKGLNFLAGLITGFALVLLIQGIALYLLVGQNPVLMQALQVFGFVYILYIAFKIARAPIVTNGTETTSPPNFLDGVILIISNPKAYAAMVAINSQMLLPYEQSSQAYFMTALTCFFVVILVDLVWLLLGKLLRPLLQTPKTGRTVRMIFAVSMVAAVIWVMSKNYYF